MKTSGYREDLRGWPMDSGPILSMPPEAKEEDVIAEAERLAALSQVLPIEDVPSVTEIGPAVDERTPDEKLDAAITEFIAATGSAIEDVATIVIEHIPIERKSVYIGERMDAAAMELEAAVKPIVVEKSIDVLEKP